MLKTPRPAVIERRFFFHRMVRVQLRTQPTVLGAESQALMLHSAGQQFHNSLLEPERSSATAMATRSPVPTPVPGIASGQPEAKQIQ